MIQGMTAFAPHRGRMGKRTTDAVRQDLAAVMADRQGEAYTRQPMFAEHVEDRIDALQDELDRRAALSRLGA